MTYAELFARVAALVPDTHTYAIEVQTFSHVREGGRDAVTHWRISVLPPDNSSCTQARCATPEEALETLAARLGDVGVDKSGVGDLVGDASVSR